MDDSNRSLMMASLQRVAMQMLELPKAERENVFNGYREGFAKDAAAAGLDPKAALEFGDKYMEFLRTLVKIIEASGGGAGGRAS
jgi:hypothetical protein